MFAATLSGSPAFGQDDDGESAISLRGFATLGVARSNTDAAEFYRDVAQPHGVARNWSARYDSLLGLQANVRATDTAELVFQGVSRYRYDGSFTPDLTLAFLRVDLSPRASMRVGRMGTEFLMFADSSLIGYSHLQVRPAVHYFGGVNGGFADGLDAEMRWPLGDGIVRASAMAGIMRQPIRHYDLRGSRLTQASLGYQDGNWQVRYVAARLQAAKDDGPMADAQAALAAAGATEAAQAFKLSGTRQLIHSLGASYDDGDWQVRAGAYVMPHGNVSADYARAAYATVGRRFGNVTPFLGWSGYRLDGKDVQTGLGPAFAALDQSIATLLAATHQRRHTTSLGMRWDFARNMDLKAQLDVSGGKPIVFAGTAQPNWNGRMTVFSVALDVVF